MRTGELAGRAGVNVETLRYYERRGLVDEVEELLHLGGGCPLLAAIQPDPPEGRR